MKKFATSVDPLGYWHWDKIEKLPDGCWIWTGARNTGGYGVARHRGRTIGAHRMTYEVFVGPLDPFLEIDHLCRNPPCVNPDHLEQVTRAENIRRVRSRQFALPGLAAPKPPKPGRRPARDAFDYSPEYGEWFQFGT